MCLQTVLNCKKYTNVEKDKLIVEKTDIYFNELLITVTGVSWKGHKIKNY